MNFVAREFRWEGVQNSVSEPICVDLDHDERDRWARSTAAELKRERIFEVSRVHMGTCAGT